MKPNGKCIAKKCEDCNFLYKWDMENKEGIRRMESKCVFLVLSEEIPRMRGSIDGAQEAAHEARNRVNDLGAIAAELKDIKLIGSK